MTRKYEHTLITYRRNVFSFLFFYEYVVVQICATQCFCFSGCLNIDCTPVVGPSTPQTSVRPIAMSGPACALQHRQRKSIMPDWVWNQRSHAFIFTWFY